MASITIRNLDDELNKRLRLRSAGYGHSMEEEARDILKTTLSLEARPPANLAEAICRRFAEIGHIELPIPRRETIREPPDLE